MQDLWYTLHISSLAWCKEVLSRTGQSSRAKWDNLHSWWVPELLAFWCCRMSSSSCLGQGTCRDPLRLKTFCLPYLAQPPCAVQIEPQILDCHVLLADLLSRIEHGIPGKVVKSREHLHQSRQAFHKNYPKLKYLSSCFYPLWLHAYFGMMFAHTICCVHFWDCHLRPRILWPLPYFSCE